MFLFENIFNFLVKKGTCNPIQRQAPKETAEAENEMPLHLSVHSSSLEVILAKGICFKAKHFFIHVVLSFINKPPTVCTKTLFAKRKFNCIFICEFTIWAISKFLVCWYYSAFKNFTSATIFCNSSDQGVCQKPILKLIHKAKIANAQH